MIRPRLCAWLCVAVAGAAAAQPQPKAPPSPLFRSPYDFGRKGDAKAFTNLMRYAACAAHLERGVAAKFLAVSYPSKDRDGQVQDLIVGSGLCAEGPVKLEFDYLRGALIEAFYDEDILRRSGKPMIKLGTSAPNKTSSPSTLAHCVVNRRPGAAAELLKTKISFPEQGKAVAQLQPDVDQCVRETKEGISFPELLRFQIAEELYRRASTGMAASQ